MVKTRSIPELNEGVVSIPDGWCVHARPGVSTFFDA